MSALPSDDLNWKTAATDLGFAAVKDSIAACAITERAGDTLRARVPLRQEDASQEQTWVGETLHLSVRGQDLPLRATPDCRSSLERLLRSAALSAEELRDLGVLLEQCRTLAAHVKTERETCPTLAATFSDPTPLLPFAAELGRCLDEHGRILDLASPALAAARRAHAELQGALRESLVELVAKYRTSLSGSYTAERNGRFVLPVRSDAANAVDGSVLGTSGSGSTLYIEPRELFSANNRVYQAQARVEAEEARVLERLNEQARSVIPLLEQAALSVDLADRLGAVASWAKRVDAIPVRFTAQPGLVLHQMRHPLLAVWASQGTAAKGPAGSAPAQQNPGEAVVANDLKATPGHAYFFSGPNAGGKTVALKCLGLSVLLAQSGLPVPCATTSEIGWFDTLITLFGDNQSVALSLSTFSAHVTRLAECLRRASPSTLLLIDEVAGGTDPDDGAALAVAVVEELVNRGASLALTTHYDRLKRLGAQGTRYTNVAVGFDFATLRPTFRVTYDAPGASSAFAVAERFGVTPEVVARAAQLLPETQRAAQALLTQIEAEKARLTGERRELEAQKAELLKRASEAEAASERREQEHRRVMERERNEVRTQTAELMRELLNARHQLEQAKQQLKSETLTKQALESIERLVSSAATPITFEGSVTRALRPASAGQALNPETLVPGLKVYLPHLNTEAEVLARPEKQQLRVSVSGLKMTVPLSQVLPTRPTGANSPGAKSAKSGLKTPKAGLRASRRDETLESASSYQPVRTSANVCDLRGVRVEAGIEQVDAFLDQMLRLQERAVFILHGHGTGAMREAVRSHLGQYRHVERFHAAAPEDGGDALTVVWFRD